ncbi:unnamed protein product [Boreogadus saida]
MLRNRTRNTEFGARILFLREFSPDHSFLEHAGGEQEGLLLDSAVAPALSREPRQQGCIAYPPPMPGPQNTHMASQHGSWTEWRPKATGVRTPATTVALQPAP